MKCFIWIFLLPLKYGVFGADEMKAVTEGDHLTLQTGFSEIQVDDRIVWLYGSEVIARIEKANGILNTYDVADGRFSGKLELDKQTGSLIIKDIRIKNTGDYQLVNKGNTAGKFMVTVYAHLPTPDIVFSDCPQTPAGSSSKICAVQCSVETVGLVTLSWYEGNNLVSSKVSDTCSIISLRLEVDYDDKNTYSCTVNNPISNQTKPLDISGLCHKCAAVPVPDTGLSPGAVALIVIGLLLLAATVACVMYFLCPRITNLPNQTWSVPHGDYVTLNPETEIQRGDEIQWLFGAGEILIAEIKGENREKKTYDGPDEIFMYRLNLETTGSLSIEFILTKHTGLYTLKIRRGRETFYKRFNVSVSERMRRLVKEGDPVCLNPDKEKEKGDEIQWLFEDKDQQTVLGEIKNTKVTEYADERFRDRLKLDENTGSLTITYLTTKHTGRYTLKITRGREKIYNKFYISVGELKITVTEGKTVMLNPAYDVNKDDLIQWLFGDEALQTGIAEIKVESGKIPKYADVADGIFRDRLELDETTGSLTIKNTRTEHTGVYRLQIFSSSDVTEQIFTVTVRDNVEEKKLKGGDSVTLKPDTKIQREDQILWMFGYQDKVIAQIKGGTVEIYDDVNKRFRDRLKLDETGSLTITKIEAEHMGLYKVLIISSSRDTLVKRFKVLIPLKYEAVTAGEPVHLNTDLTEIKKDDEIEWRFGDENALIAEIKGGTVETHDVPDERFRDGLELNKKTGDLIIKNSTTEHDGHYTLKIRSSKGNKYRIYSVTIRYAAVTKQVRTESSMKEKSDSRGKRVNDSATVVMEKDRLLDGDYVNVENEEGMSSL